ncbi:MAG: GspH/FimT family pseudopilin, partial [Rhodanobacteraceae bacterium]
VPKARAVPIVCSSESRVPSPESRLDKVPSPDSRLHGVPNPESQARGFTLLEMMAVLILIAIAVTAVSMSVARSLESAHVNAVSRDLAAALRYTRGQAIVKGKEQVITFNLKDWTYQPPHKPAKKLPEGMQLKVRTAAEEQVDADTWGLRFYPDGSSTGGRITVIRGQREWHINVSWLTGEVRTEEVKAS